MTNYLIFGASRGLGAVFSHQLPTAGDKVWLVSRSQPDVERDGVEREWIQADLSADGVSRVIAAAVDNHVLDVCLYNAGIWEEYAFSDKYHFEDVDDEVTAHIIAVNLTSAITCVQKLLPALRRSNNGKIIFIGSNAGLENARQPEVAYAASKFGLRGVTHALREVVRRDNIGVTCVNLGTVGGVTYRNGEIHIEPEGIQAVPLTDLIAIIKCIINLSNQSCIKEIDLLAMHDGI